MAPIAGCIFDIDGTVARGKLAIPGVAEALQALRQQGLRMAFCSQEHNHPPAAVAARLNDAGIAAGPGEVVTAGMVAVAYLRRRFPRARVFPVGVPAFVHVLQSGGVATVDLAAATTADVVLVGEDRGLTYDTLKAACRAIWHGACFLAVNQDRALPVEDGLIPATGPLVQAIAYATRHRPVVLGKPSRWMARAALQIIGAPAEQVVVVGDQVAQDIRLGKAAGCSTVLVLSGGTAPADVPRLPARLRPDGVLPDATHLPAWLAERARSGVHARAGRG